MLADKIKTDTISAMKSGDSLRVSVLRMLASELNYKKIDLQRDLTDEDVLGVIMKEIKKRREAIEAYTSAGRQDQAEVEQKELQILQEYVPAQMSEEEIRKELSGIKEIEGLTEFGQVMKIVSPMFKGRAEGSLVAKTVKEMLGNA